MKINDNVCDRGQIFIEQTQICKELCGDGVQLEVDCDDGNIRNNDGCSDQCLIESGFVCDSVATDSPSVCRLNVTLSMEDIKIKKTPGSN